VVLLDCCYSGSAKIHKGTADDAARLGSSAINNKGSQLLNSGEGLCILSASQAYQEAVILTEKNHSLFTYFLLQGLQGKEEAVDNRGYVTADSLANYVYNEIMSLPDDKRFGQKPLRILEASGNIILAHYPHLAKQVVDRMYIIQEIVTNAKRYLHKGEFQTAFDYLEQAIDKYPNNLELWLYKGICSRNLMKYEEELKCFEISLILDPHNSMIKIHNGLAYNSNVNLHVRNEEYKEALGSIEKALQYLPNNKLIWNEKGEILAKLRKSEEALECFDKALQIDPNYEEVWNNKGLALHSLQSFQTALYCFDRVLATSPNLKDVLFNKAATLDKMGNHVLAERCRRRAETIIGS
jgi:tetratricopeptide (TPR) repeat protein